MILRYFASLILQKIKYKKIQLIRLIYISFVAPLMLIDKKKRKAKEITCTEISELFQNGSMLIRSLDGTTLKKLEESTVIIENNGVGRSKISNEMLKHLIYKYNITEVAKTYFDGFWNKRDLIIVAFKEKRIPIKYHINEYDHATFYHRDIEGVRQLKIFIYLDNTTKENGAHEYILKSHLLDKKDYFKIYNRFSPECYDMNVENVRYDGPPGMAILEDTFGLHRAGNVLNGERNMLIINIYAKQDYDAFGGTIHDSKYTTTEIISG
jgi:hypothetical protein